MKKLLEAIYKLLEKTNNPVRSAYIWNGASAITMALQSPVILAVANRTNGAEDAGIYSIAIAVANLMLFLGQYGLRRYQSSDVRQEFSFSEYHAVRLITCGAMVITCLGYCVIGLRYRGYSTDKFVIVYMVCLIKTVQAYADVLHGHLQQRGRLDIACKASVVRYLAELGTYVIVLTTTHNLVLAVSICLPVTLVLMFITSFNSTTYYCDSVKPEIDKDKFKLLMIEGFPLFASMFLNMYIGNAPKYAIDAYLTDDIQAIYNMIFMPTYVVQMVTQFIFNPVLTVYAELWLEHSKEKFITLMKMLRKMCLIILGLAIVAILMAVTIGIPVLSVVFGADLSEYRKELCVIMVAGGMLAYSIYFSTIIAVIRAQRPLIICYGLVAVAAKVMSKFFVLHNGVMGAAVLNAILMTALALSLLAVCVHALNKEWKVLNEKSPAD